MKSFPLQDTCFTPYPDITAPSLVGEASLSVLLRQLLYIEGTGQ